ncbi:MAG: hypothetical protein IAE82_01455 [Opitutaceae bacterium]|nr:hypothetical protein [Opitutaceae bacterium]
MRILGISAFYHDSAAALLEDGRIVAAVQEERFTRVKHDASFPREAVRHCLSRASGPLDAVAYYEKPLLKFERILRTAFFEAPFGFRAFCAAMPVWLRQKLWIRSLVEDSLAELGHDVRGRVLFTGHHQAHAASTFFASPFGEAAVLTVDGVGEWTTTAIARGSGNRLDPLREIEFPHSLGLLYSAFTYFCGFRVNSGEYKLMGLAPYGEPRFAATIRENLVDVRPDGSFRLNLDYFGFLRGERMTNRRFASLFGGPPRLPEAPLTARECDLARSVQEVTEEIILGLAREARRVTGAANLCLAGGVALNCVANARLLREGPFERIWVQPASGDAGGALGAALAVHHLHFGAPRTADGCHDIMRGAFLGPEYSADEMRAELERRGLPFRRLGDAELYGELARLLARGDVLGIVAGAAEFGPRALGHRSILADARRSDVQRTLNLKIKQRESFRPFAPIVLVERAQEYFELASESPYMLLTAPVRAERRTPRQPEDGRGLDRIHAVRSDIPAVTHVDYSARVQTVDRIRNPEMHALLTEFDRLTGCPVLVNTSFNVRGEPPVCHPREAIDGFLATEMDCLALGPFIVEKRNLPPGLVRSFGVARTFAPD